MKKISNKLIVGMIAVFAVSLFIFLDFANSPQKSEDAKLITTPTATTSPFIPPVVSTSADNFDRTGTTTFTSKILDIEFDYPLTMGILTEKILPPDNDKGGPFEKWSIYHTQTAVDKYSNFSIRADNKITANSAYEGCGPMFKYYGQPLENICNTKEFLNTDVYDVELNKCETRKSEEGVPYIYFEAKGVSHCEYGKSDEKSRIFSFIPQARADTIVSENTYRRTGVFFKTQSDKWPGMSFTVNSIEWGEGAWIFPSGSKSKNGILPIKNIQLIESVARTLRYAK